jgi:formiminotetrahydrofolate cyclodeaminase
VYNVRINVSSLEDKSRGKGLLDEANKILAQTHAFAEQAGAAVDKAIG